MTISIAPKFNKYLTQSYTEFSNVGEFLYSAALKLRLDFKTDLVTDNVVVIKIAAFHTEKFPTGPFFEYATGHGSTQEDAIDCAAQWWVENEFPVLHAYITGNNPAVQTAKMASQTGDKKHGWNILLGPVAVKYNLDNLQTNHIEEDLVGYFITELRNEITGFFHTPEVLWFKCYVGKFPDGQIQIDARVCGTPWKEGAQKLHQLASEWKFESFHSRKQLFLIHPDEVDPLMQQKVSEEVARRRDENSVAKTTNKKWFEFWK